MDNIISVEGVSKSFANHIALDNVSLNVPRGCVYGLLGPNGAGKTTLIRTINHITAPDSGTITFNGHRLTAADTSDIGYLPEERGLYKKMKVGDQALFFARLKGLSKTEATKELKKWFEHLEISDWWDKKVEDLSKGMAQKVQFIVTVLHHPKLLIFDEPFSGFDPINANVLKREILKLRDEGATVIFSTHNMASVEELCDEITLINRSHNILSGSVRNLKRRFSDNSYEFTFSSGSQAAYEALAPMAHSIEQAGTDNEGFERMTLRLRESSDLQLVVAAANSCARLEGFHAILPSMDDIFIKTVEASNLKTPAQQ